MKKIKLDLARLSVETFDTAALARAPRGTVRGLAGTEPVECTAMTNCQQITCGYSCPSNLPYCMPTELEYATCGIGPRDNC